LRGTADFADDTDGDGNSTLFDKIRQFYDLSLHVLTIIGVRKMFLIKGLRWLGWFGA
jgi:hypothetical protein